MNTQYPLNEEFWKLLAQCGGYYECRKDGNGKRLTPLVGYAGDYDVADGKKKNYVGDIYANCAMFERHGPVLQRLATWLCHKALRDHNGVFTAATGFCGAPMGGIALASAMSSLFQRQFIFPEKKVVAVATAEAREKSITIFDRHIPGEGESYFIVEDVCNNFSTTAKLIASIEETGASVVGILCLLNRSLEIDTEYSPKPGQVLPVIAIERKDIPQYKQDNPFVADDIAAGNVCWKPKVKEEWARLMAA